MSLIARVIVSAAAALSFAAVPIYPGATFDAPGSKAASAAHPAYPYKVYVTPDSYEKVVAFYKSKGASQSMPVSIGNNELQKLAMLSMKDGTIQIAWPADIRDKNGKIIARKGTSIAIGS